MLRLIGNLLVWVGVIVGSAAVLTIYQPKLTASDAALEGLTLDRSVTIYAKTDESPEVPEQIVLARDTVLDAQNLELLRSSSEETIVVREFAWRAWRDWWMFGVGAAMMIVGAFCMRLSARREIAMMTDVDEEHEASPQATIIAIRGVLEKLAEELPALPDDQMRCDTVVSRLDQVQQSYIPTFITGRASLIGKHGLAGYANIMDRFAALERQVNRAWSSAADGYFDESAECIATALTTLPEVEQRLGIPPATNASGQIAPNPEP